MGESRYRNLLESIDEPFPLADAFHSDLIDLLRRYYFVGGMPEAVKHFTKAGNGREAREIQEEIIKSYVLDFAKHAPPSDIPKLTQIWDSIPKHLARENKKAERPNLIFFVNLEIGFAPKLINKPIFLYQLCS